MGNIRRVYFHYQDLEEYHAGMWRMVHGADIIKYRDAAADLLRDPEEFKNSLEMVLLAWPNSCSAALSAEAVNRIAWLGWAGCCLEVDAPESCTRLGWHTLTQRERDEANRVAGEVLAHWERENEREERPTLFMWAESA